MSAAHFISVIVRLSSQHFAQQ